MIDTYTMLYDSLIADLGLLRAAVLCAVLRYATMSDGLCRASQRTIAGRLHLSVGLVQRSLKQLVADGYLQDLTPDRRNAPHRYRDGGRLRGSAPVPQPAASEAAPAAEPVNATAHPVSATAHPMSATVHDVSATAHVEQERRLLRDTEYTPEDTPVPASQPPAPPEIILVKQVCGHVPPSWNYEAAVKAVRQMGTRLGRAPAPADLLPFWKEWLRRGYHASNDAWLTDWARLGVPSRIANDSLSKLRGQSKQPAAGERPCAAPLPERPSAGRDAGARPSLSEEERLVRFYNGLAAA